MGRGVGRHGDVEPAESRRKKALRLFAWRYSEPDRKTGKRYELPHCGPDCGYVPAERLTLPGYNAADRAARNCALPGFPRSRWTSQVGGDYFGDLDAQGDEVPELVDEGCPRSWWVLSPWVASVARYVPIENASGHPLPCPDLERTDDPLVLEAVSHFQRELTRVAQRDLAAMRPTK